MGTFQFPSRKWPNTKLFHCSAQNYGSKLLSLLYSSISPSLHILIRVSSFFNNRLKIQIWSSYNISNNNEIKIMPFTKMQHQNFLCWFTITRMNKWSIECETIFVIYTLDRRLMSKINLSAKLDTHNITQSINEVMNQRDSLNKRNINGQ